MTPFSDIKIILRQILKGLRLGEGSAMMTVTEYVEMCKRKGFYPSKPMKQHVAQEKFTELYTSESDKLFRYCFLRVSDRDQALDITQESFTRLWDNIAKGLEINNLRSFLFKIAHNLIIDWYRKKKAGSLDALTDSDGDDSIHLQIADDTQIELDVGTEGRMLVEKIKLLDATYQHVVYLRFIEDLSPKEISEIVELSVNVVSVRINRGINELRKMLHLNEEK